MPKDDAKTDVDRKVAAVTEAIGKIVGDQAVEDRGRIALKAVNKPKKPVATRR